MSINKLAPSKRAKAAIAAAMISAAAGGWYSYKDTSPKTPPPAVVLATDHLIKTWEGVVLTAHWDRYAKIFDICYGKTRVNGKHVTANMRFTKAECDNMLKEDVFKEYYIPLTQKISGFTSFPVSVQAAQISGAYNFGVAGMVGSTAAKFAKQGKYREACEAQTAWNKAGGQVVKGLVNRREMGDAQRIGEAELCLSGI